ncbi:zf-TFIIB domain-containing protein [Microbacterium sp. GXF0217]
MDDLERQRELRVARDEVLSTPNCPNCLHRMDTTERTGVAMWHCYECGTEQD